MKRMRTGHAGRTLAAMAGVATGVVVVGLLLWAVFAGPSPAAAETDGGAPGRGPERVSERVAERFHRSIPERIVEGIRGPRVEAPEGRELKLTVPEMERVRAVPVYDAPERREEAAMHDGALHVRGTGFPWQREANVYIAGHRVGFPGTQSDRVFWDLDKLGKGDEISLTDADGTRYTYKVFREFVVDPGAVYVTRPMDGKNIVSLQTCTLPDYSQRLIVQGELKSVD